jgi:hypothetical protein
MYKFSINTGDSSAVTFVFVFILLRLGIRAASNTFHVRFFMSWLLYILGITVARLSVEHFFDLWHTYALLSVSPNKR